MWFCGGEIHLTLFNIHKWVSLTLLDRVLRTLFSEHFRLIFIHFLILYRFIRHDVAWTFFLIVFMIKISFDRLIDDFISVKFEIKKNSVFIFYFNFTDHFLKFFFLDLIFNLWFELIILQNRIKIVVLRYYVREIVLIYFLPFRILNAWAFWVFVR